LPGRFGHSSARFASSKKTTGGEGELAGHLSRPTPLTSLQGQKP
jgi:hypothetical protein